MTELPLIVLAGLLGSSHCVGMCGGFAVAVGSKAAHWRENLVRQTAYGFGRLFTYAVIGAAAGYGGTRLAAALNLINVQAILAIAAGALLIVQGLRATGMWLLVVERFQRRRHTVEVDLPPKLLPAVVRPAGFRLPHCLRPGLLGSMLRRTDLAGPVFAGMLTGFLPCGLVYAMAALAVSCGDFVKGVLIMLCFGIGTFPLLIALGIGTSMVGVKTRRLMFQMAAWSVVATGALSLGRGAYALSTERIDAKRSNLPVCPLCRSTVDHPMVDYNETHLFERNDER